MERTDPQYVESVRFLLDRVNYEKTVDQPYDQQRFRLARMRLLLDRLGNPQRSAPVIHIAGTKGKGSVAWFIAETLRRSGRTTGLYTSPHLEFLEERFVLDGSPVPPQRLVDWIPKLRQAAAHCAASEHGEPTFFELTTALAWSLFQESRTQCNVVEVGLGGRLDSTNVCDPLLTVITSISLDHQQQLGPTLVDIASEKAGIVKPGIPLIHGVRQQAPRDVIRNVAKQLGCELWELGTDFEVQLAPCDSATSPYATVLNFLPLGPRWSPSNFEPLTLRMLGDHQAANAALAVVAWARLNDAGWQIPWTALRDALAETQVPARIEILREAPWMLVDAAHNEASAAGLVRVLEQNFPDTRKTIVFACSKDKKVREILGILLTVADRLILTQYQNNPRFVPVERLEELARDWMPLSDREVEILSAPDSATAIDFALQGAGPSDLVCVTGSFFVAAEARQYWNERSLSR